MNGDDAWDPLPFPTRKSPFYTLKSIAFSKDADSAVLSRVGDHGGVNGGCGPPKVASNGNQGLNQDPQIDGNDASKVDKLMARREAALAETRRLNEMIEQMSDKISCEQRMRGAAEVQTRGLVEKTQQVRDAMRNELAHIYQQQQQLRDLRSRMRKLHGNVPQSTLPTSKVPHVSQSSLDEYHRAVSAHDSIKAALPEIQKLSDEGRKDVGAPTSSMNEKRSSPVNFELPPTPDSCLIENHAAQNAADENIVSGAQPARSASSSRAKRRSPDGPPSERSWRTRSPEGHQLSRPSTNLSGGSRGSRGSRGLDEDEAEIELLRTSTSALARLRHPSGSEALVDLRVGLILSWTLAGHVAGAGAMPSLRPQMLGRAKRSAWRVTLLDDLNNEPSVALTCGGEGTTWWRARRTITLGANFLREDLDVENISGAPHSFSIEEERCDAKMQKQLVDDLLAQRKVDQPMRVESVPISSGPDAYPPPCISLEPGESQSFGHIWTPDLR